MIYRREISMNRAFTDTTVMDDDRGGMSADDACDVLWPLIRRQACLPDTEEAPSKWRGALDRLMALSRPDAGWCGRCGEMSSAYADHTHSGGWTVACIIKLLRRIAAAREHAAVSADPVKCKVLNDS